MKLKISLKQFLCVLLSVLAALGGAALAAGTMKVLCAIAFPQAAASDHQLGVIAALVDGMALFGAAVGLLIVLFPGRRLLSALRPMLLSLGLILLLCLRAHANLRETGLVLLLSASSLFPVTLFAGALGF